MKTVKRLISKIKLCLLKRRIGYVSYRKNGRFKSCCCCTAFKHYGGFEHCDRYGFRTDIHSVCSHFTGIMLSQMEKEELEKAKSHIWETFENLNKLIGGDDGIKRKAAG